MKSNQSDQEKIVSGIFEAIIRIANSDYSSPISIIDNDDELRAVSVGLNMLMEELEASTVSREVLQSEYQNFRAALDLAPNSILVTDQKGKIQYFNIQAQRCFNYKEEEVLGKPIEFLMPSRYKEMHHGHMAHYSKSPSTMKMGERKDLWAKRKDDSEFAVDIMIGPLNWENKPATLAIIRDVTKEQIDQKKLDNWVVELEQKVKERTNELEKKNELLKAEIEERERISAILEQKNKDFSDSVQYASYIQQAFLSPLNSEECVIKNQFLISLPKDVLSGDFHWCHRDLKNECSYLAIGDCTGHGVPGSLLTILAVQLLEQNCIGKNEKIEPENIISNMNASIKSFLHKDQKSTLVNDGLELAMIRIDGGLEQLAFTGAGRPLIHFRDGEMNLYAGNKVNIGGFVMKPNAQLNHHTIEYKKGDRFYAFSDGFQDQFGGPRDRKFGRKALLSLLEEIQDKPMNLQKDQILKAFEIHKGDQIQIDDVVLLGFEF